MFVVLEVFEEKINGIRFVRLVIDGGIYVFRIFFCIIYLFVIL